MVLPVGKNRLMLPDLITRTHELAELRARLEKPLFNERGKSIFDAANTLHSNAKTSCLRR